VDDELLSESATVCSVSLHRNSETSRRGGQLFDRGRNCHRPRPQRLIAQIGGGRRRINEIEPWWGPTTSSHQARTPPAAARQASGQAGAAAAAPPATPPSAGGLFVGRVRLASGWSRSLPGMAVPGRQRRSDGLPELRLAGPPFRRRLDVRRLPTRHQAHRSYRSATAGASSHRGRPQ
jgi:hypothetical protein